MESTSTQDGGWLLLWLALGYFLPALIAAVRGQPNTAAIFVVDLFLGWTLIGWVVALAWALAAKPARQDR